MAEVLAPFLARFFWRDDAVAEEPDHRFKRRWWLAVIAFSFAAWGLAIWALIVWLF